MKKLFAFAAMVAITATASAQKSEIAKGRAAFDASVKKETYKDDNGNDAQRDVVLPEKIKEAQEWLAKAKLAWDEAKADPKKASKIKSEVIASGYDLKGDIYQRIMAQELNHAVAREPLDTMLFFTSLTACLDAYEECYKVDEKGQYTPKNQINFIKFRPYYMYAGQFFSTNSQTVKAADAFDKWLDFAKKYTITGGDDAIGNTGDNSFDRSMVAYYAALSLYQGKAYDGMAKYEEEAMNYQKEADMVRQVFMAAAMEQGDTARWEKMAHKFALEGVGGDGVVQNLMAHYFSQGDNTKVMAFAKELAEAQPGNKMGPYAIGIVYMNDSKYEEAAQYFEKTIAIDPEYVDALYNAGVCWCNQGYAVNDALNGKKMTKAENDKEIAKVRDLYRKAEPFFLKIQELLPDQPERWARRLSQIYYIIDDKAKQQEYEALAGD